MSLSSLKSNLSNYDELINENYSTLSGLRSILLEDVSASVLETLGGTDTPNMIYDNVELDENWWNENAARLGWVKDGNYYSYTDPDTGDVYSYNPKDNKLNVTFSNGSKRNGIVCRLFLSGDLADVNETITCLKNQNGSNCNIGDTANSPRLLIVPSFGAESQDTAINSYLSSRLGDQLLGSAGNKSVKHSLAGFSAGGYESLYMVSGERDHNGFKISGYYDKVTLINISPRKIEFNDTQIANMSGLEFDIVSNYNNLNESGVSITADYYNKQRGGPYLDKLLQIPDVKVSVYVPDLSQDTHGDVTKFSAYAEGLGVNVIDFPIPEGKEKDFGSGYGTSHESGRHVLFGYYLSGQCDVDLN